MLFTMVGKILEYDVIIHDLSHTWNIAAPGFITELQVRCMWNFSCFALILLVLWFPPASWRLQVGVLVTLNWPQVIVRVCDALQLICVPPRVYSCLV